MDYNPQTISLPQNSDWYAILKDPYRKELESRLPDFLRKCRWFGGKAKSISGIKALAGEFLPKTRNKTFFLTVIVSYEDYPDDHYLLPLSCRFTGQEEPPGDISMPLARIRIGGREGIIYDASGNPEFRKACFNLIAREEVTGGEEEYLHGIPGKSLRGKMKYRTSLPESRLLRKEQSNTSFIYGNEYILKLYRRVTDTSNPEVEIIRFLTEVADFTHIAPFAGLIEEIRSGSRSITLALLQSYVEHDDDAWTYFLNAARHCFSQPQNLIDDKYLKEVELLGKRTAQLHQALASNPGNPDFSPEPYSLSDREVQLNSSLSLLEEVFRNLKNSEERLRPGIRDEAGRLLAQKPVLIDRIRRISDQPDPGMKIRIHGDYHLGQVLRTEDDFVIIDFEGEPARNIVERRRKRSPLIDVAGMIRSFHYAAYGTIFLKKTIPPEEIAAFSPRAEDWYQVMSGTFLDSYLATMAQGSVDLLPDNRKVLNRMLEFFLLDKAVYELNYELNNRPEWAIIPLRGIKLNDSQTSYPDK
ncbi:MAG: putative maltokinase [Candidatus Auribacterota bacterium]|nr:putative maltokinase [Candidatus Auribacterota bacterium]